MRLLTKLCISMAIAVAAVTTFDASPAQGQAAPAYQPGRDAQEANPYPTKNMCWSGTAWSACRTRADGSVVTSDIDGTPVTVTPQTSAAVLWSVNAGGYAGVSFQPMGTYSGTVTYEGSNDTTDGTNGTWSSVSAIRINGGDNVNSTTSNTPVFIPSNLMWLRARVSTYTSGTFSGSAFLRSYSPLPVSSQTINYKALFYSDMTLAALAANATSPGTSRDLGSSSNPSNYNKWTCFASPDAASTGAILAAQGSTNGTTWITLGTVSAATTAPVTYEARIFYRYNRCLFTNGATAQTALSVAGQYGE